MGCGCGPWKICTGEVYDEKYEYCVNCGERRLRDIPGEDDEPTEEAPTYTELAAENEQLHEQLAQKVVDQTFITDLAAKNGSLHMTLEGGMMQIMADHFAVMIMESGAENYLEMSFGSERFLPEEMLVCTLQRCKGKTPHQLRTEEEAKIAQVRAALERCKAATKIATSEEYIRANRRFRIDVETILDR